MKKYFCFPLMLLLLSCTTRLPHSADDYLEFTDLYPGTSYERIDREILNLKKHQDESIDALITTINQTASNDWEKVRAVYIWITHNISYDTNGYFSGEYAPTNAEGVFESRKSVCSGYANLFNDLLDKLNVKSEVITGYAKGYSFQGDDPGGTNHAWNIVEINGEQHLFDSTWGAGSLFGKKFRWYYKEFYFDADPEKFICNHFPVSQDKQLLKNPIDRESFFRLPNMNINGFECEIDFSDLIERARSGETISAPVFYATSAEYKLLEFPLREVLKSGQKYRFLIESPQTNMMIKNGTDDFRIIPKKNGSFLIEDSFRKGTLTLYLSSPREGYSGILKYRVE